MEQNKRTIMLIGEENFKKITNKTIMIFGCGGVGGFVIESLARSGVNNLILIDNDEVKESNLNRQIIATTDTIGKLKVDVFKKHLLAINPNINIKVYPLFILKDNITQINFRNVDYIIDCVDTVTAKITIIETAKQLNIPVISSMGTGNKLDQTKLKIVDIKKTHTCPLAKVMRYELKKRNITDVLVLFSEETPITSSNNITKEIPSMIFVPSIAGIMIAQRVILDLINTK